MNWVSLIPAGITAMIAIYCFLNSEDKYDDFVSRIWSLILGVVLFVVTIWLCQLGMDYSGRTRKAKESIEYSQPFIGNDYIF
jgi:hypothetical protein